MCFWIEWLVGCIYKTVNSLLQVRADLKAKECDLSLKKDLIFFNKCFRFWSSKRIWNLLLGDLTFQNAINDCKRFSFLQCWKSNRKTQGRIQGRRRDLCTPWDLKMTSQLGKKSEKQKKISIYFRLRRVFRFLKLDFFVPKET